MLCERAVAFVVAPPCTRAFSCSAATVWHLIENIRQCRLSVWWEEISSLASVYRLNCKRRQISLQQINYNLCVAIDHFSTLFFQFKRHILSRGIALLSFSLLCWRLWPVPVPFLNCYWLYAVWVVFIQCTRCRRKNQYTNTINSCGAWSLISSIAFKMHVTITMNGINWSNEVVVYLHIIELWATGGSIVCKSKNCLFRRLVTSPTHTHKHTRAIVWHRMAVAQVKTSV